MMTSTLVNSLVPLWAATPGVWYEQPLLWALILGVLALVLIVPRSSTWQRVTGGACAIGAGVLFVVTALQATPQSATHDWIAISVFALLAIVTVGSAIAMIGSRSAVYCAIWFAVTLLGTAGLFLYQGAAFLGVATIVVYAGAIVVLFLFVIMLAQPDGHASYDRISWGWFAKPAAATAGALIVGAVVAGLDGFAASDLRSQVALAADRLAAADETFPLSGNQIVSATRDAARQHTITLQLRGADVELPPEATAALAQELATILAAAQPTNDADDTDAADTTVEPLALVYAPPLLIHHDLLTEHHMAHFGGHLFSRHLIAVEVAGTLLLVSLVGAIAMLAQGPGGSARGEGDAHV
jgi:NADH-quinone oxidoreductase subunit J